MNILALVPDAFGGHGGIALYNRDLLTGLSAHSKCGKVVAIPRLMPYPSGPLPEKLIYISDAINSKKKYLKALIATLKKSRDFDLIICGHINLLPFAYFAKMLTNSRILLEIYGIDAWKPSRRFLTSFFLQHVTGVISISEYTKNKFLSWSKLDGNKVHLLPNAIDISKYGVRTKNPTLLSRYGLHGKKVIMTLGRLVSQERQKGFDEIVELLPELINQVPNVAYLIAGDGPDKERLRNKVSSLDLEDRVIFTGFVPESEKADLYRLADAYVMPSQGEGFGFVFLEAMACGIPVVASSRDGSREAVRDGELGMLVDPSNPKEIKTAILKALAQKSGFIPKGLEYFSYDNFQQQLHHLIDITIHN